MDMDMGRGTGTAAETGAAGGTAGPDIGAAQDSSARASAPLVPGDTSAEVSASKRDAQSVLATAKIGLLHAFLMP